MQFIRILISSLALILASYVGITEAGQPLSVKVVLRGKKYSIPSVTTVKELQNVVQEKSGVNADKQGRVLFGGKKLQPNDVLEDMGVENGSVINIVPSKGGDKKKASSSSIAKKSSAGNGGSGESAASSGEGNMIESMLKQAGIDSSQLDELMKSMPGGGSGGEMPSMQESMEMMQEMMNSPMFQEYMNDPEKLEQSRQMILNNPMMKGMMASMPGFDEILNDPIKWRETMVAAANMYKGMGKDLMNAMANNPGGMGGMGGMGGFGGAPGAFGLGGSMGDDAESPTALDELSEGED